ncbi:TPA: Gfo/Idh/MocA family oxidoreductase [Candidatus Poribacteria bacterium]|nr:Gfo/Idh/MocA family oxidoreductase [Candidatus Poribacteria bacterium]
MAKEIRFGIVGLGMGANRADIASKTPGAKLSCVCDIVEANAKKVAEKYGCAYETDYEKMLKRDDVDVVGVMTPSGLHAEFAIMAAKAGKHVFTTKPMDILVEKCDELIETAKNAGVILAVDFGERYLSANKRVRKAIQSGMMGKVFLADLRMKWYRSQGYYDGGSPAGWRSKRRYEGGSAANQGVHFIDLIQWFMGPVKTVIGKSATIAHNIETEDLSLAILEFENGAYGVLQTTTCNNPDLGSAMEFSGTNGTISWKNSKVELFSIADKPNASLDEIEVESGPANIIEDMVSAINNGTPVAVDGYEGRKSVVIFNAIYESSKIGRPVNL